MRWAALIAAQVAARRLRNCSLSPAVRWHRRGHLQQPDLGAGHRSRIMKGVTTALGIYFVWWVFVMLFVFFLSDLGGPSRHHNDEVIISNAVLVFEDQRPVIPPMAVLVIVRNMLQGIQHIHRAAAGQRGLELIGKVIFGVWIVPAVGYTAVCFCEPVTWVICFVFILGAVPLPGELEGQRISSITYRAWPMGCACFLFTGAVGCFIIKAIPHNSKCRYGESEVRQMLSQSADNTLYYRAFWQRQTPAAAAGAVLGC